MLCIFIVPVPTFLGIFFNKLEAELSFNHLRDESQEVVNLMSHGSPSLGSGSSSHGTLLEDRSPFHDYRDPNLSFSLYINRPSPFMKAS